MKITSAARLLALATALALPGIGLAQTADAPPKHVPLQKKIGEARPQVVPSLIVMNSGGASLADGKLVLTNVAGNAIIFADRPVRAAGHAYTATLIDEWSDGKDSFGADPPNATVSVFGASEDAVYDAVVVLKAPVMDGSTLTFEVDVLEGSLDGATGPAAVFIDIIGRPLTPMSYAGVARRTADRAAWYGAAGLAAGAAIGAAEAAPYYAAPAVAAPGQPCGHYPYPTCP